MDQSTVETWLAGDALSRRKISNGLSSAADLLLDRAELGGGGTRIRPSLSDDAGRRREEAAAIAQRVMAARPASVAMLLQTTLLESCQAAVRELRATASYAGEGHGTPEQVTAQALGLASHGEGDHGPASCASCGREAEVVLALLGTLVTTEDEAAEYEIEDDEDEDLPTAPPGGTLLADAATGLYDAVYNDIDITTFMPVVVDRPMRDRPPRPTGRHERVRGRSGGASQRGGTEPRNRTPVLAGILCVLGLVVLAANSRGDWEPTFPDSARQGLVEAADRGRPPRLKKAMLTAGEPGLVAGLTRRPCKVAAPGLEEVFDAHPTNGMLGLYAAGYWVCAGEGARALETLEELSWKASDFPRMRWIRAQALLLEGRGEDAVRELHLVQRVDPSMAAVASQQMELLRSLAD